MDSLLTSAAPPDVPTKIKSKADGDRPKLERSFDEPLKLLPVAFMLTIILSLWCVYVVCHCWPLLEVVQTRSRGMIELIIFNINAVLLLSCYARSVFTHPGTIPDKDSSSGGTSWEVDPVDRRLQGNLEGKVFLEKKRLGARRDCKWCGKFKPDRCHHCRVCRMCVLKMDHHCPWIYNCVGYHNFKYFFLLITYSCTALHFMTWTMLPTVHAALTDPYTPFMRMFVLLFGETLAGFIAFLLTLFVSFHIYLMLNGLTTIEFCEKSNRKRNFTSPSYSVGFWADIKAVLGDNMLLWFLPWSPPSGDGMSFVTEDTPLRLVEEGHHHRRKAHAKGSTPRGTPRQAKNDEEQPAKEGEPDVDPLMPDKSGNGY